MKIIMGKTIRGADRKLKQRLKDKRQQRNKRSIYIEPRRDRDDKTREGGNLYGDGLYN